MSPVLGMKLRVFVVIVFCLEGSAAYALSQQYADINANVMAAMKDQYVGHIDLDGSIVTDVELVSSCKTRFVTSSGSTVIDWTIVQDPAPHIEGSRNVVPINSSSGSHEFSAPNDTSDQDLDERMFSGLGLLFLDCQPGH